MNRILYVELLRIFAVTLVVVIHVSASFWYSVDINGFQWKTFHFYDSLARAAVPLFVMISGMFLLQPKKALTIKQLFTKNISRLVTAYLFWSFTYVLYMFVRQDKAWSLETFDWFVTTFIKGHYHLWYIPMLIGLYLLTPVLRAVTEKEDKRLLEYLIGLFFLFGIAKKTLLLFDIPDYVRLSITEIPMEAFVDYTGYYMLGYYLYTYHMPKALRFTMYILGLSSVFVTYYVGLAVSIENGKATEILYNNHAVTTFFESVTILLLFKYALSNWQPSEKTSSFIQKMSGCTFGIYLVHDVFIKELKYAGLTTVSFNPVLSVPIIVLAVLLFSAFTVMVLKKIKYVNKYIV